MNWNSDFAQLRLWKKHKKQEEEEARISGFILTRKYTRKYKIKRIFFLKFEIKT
jgi:hypothetical protein